MDIVLFQDFVEIKSNLHEKLSKNYGIACRTAFIQNDKKKYYLSIGTSSRIPIYPEMIMSPLFGGKTYHNHKNYGNKNTNNENVNNINNNEHVNQKDESNVITLSFNRKSCNIEQYISIRFNSRDVFLLWHKGIRESLGNLKLTKALDYREKEKLNNGNNCCNLLNLLRIEKALQNVSISLLLPSTHDHVIKVKKILQLRGSIDEVLCCLKYKKALIPFEELSQIVKDGERFVELKNDFHYQLLQEIAGHGPLVTPEDIKQICLKITDLKPPNGIELTCNKISKIKEDNVDQQSSKSSSSVLSVVASSPMLLNKKSKAKVIVENIKVRSPSIKPTTTSTSASRRSELRKKQSKTNSNLHHLSSTSLCLIVILALVLGTMIPRVIDTSSPSHVDPFSSVTQQEIGFDANMRVGDLLTQSFADPSSLFPSPLNVIDDRQRQRPINTYNQYPFRAADGDVVSSQMKTEYRGGSRIIHWFSNRIRLLLIQLIQRFLYGSK